MPGLSLNVAGADARGNCFSNGKSSDDGTEDVLPSTERSKQF